ncbi:hypothetical protein [Paludisphaera rhizosphaerae]|uniref:hypothetical protein n=1 Tax=Paludisphaera rhizosphaerae TaxID=2711216 RepID=UPI0013EB0799|nr:hypothetical protein [Paludisphaera rhizosphaerae]
MRIRSIIGLSASAWALLAGVGWAGETPKVGERCRVEMNAVTVGRNETVATYEGVVTRVSPGGVSLKVTESKQTITRKTPLARAPFVSRFFRNVGIGRPAPGEEKDIWLPTASIHSLKPIGNGSANPADGPIKTPAFDEGLRRVGGR